MQQDRKIPPMGSDRKLAPDEEARRDAFFTCVFLYAGSGYCLPGSAALSTAEESQKTSGFKAIWLAKKLNKLADG